MADITGPGVYRAQTAVPVTAYQNAETQQREFDRQLKENLQNRTDQPGRSAESASEGDAQREAAKARRVAQAGAQDESNSSENRHSRDSGAERGRNVDLET